MNELEIPKQATHIVIFKRGITTPFTYPGLDIPLREFHLEWVYEFYDDMGIIGDVVYTLDTTGQLAASTRSGNTDLTIMNEEEWQFSVDNETWHYRKVNVHDNH